MINVLFKLHSFLLSRTEELILNNIYKSRTVVLAELAERSLPTPEVCGSNSIIGKIYIEYCLLSTVMKRRKEDQRGLEWPI